MITGVVLIFVEYLSKWTKSPWFDIYDRRDQIQLDPHDPENWSKILAQKDDKIHKLIAQNRLLKSKITKMSQIKSLGKPWYKRYMNFK